MSNTWQGPSVLPNTPTSVAEQSSNDVSRSSTAPPPQISVPVLSSSSSHAGPSSTRTPVSTFSIPFNGIVKRPRDRNWTAEEEEISKDTASRFVPVTFFKILSHFQFICYDLRFATSIAADQIAVLYPDVDTPFADTIDILNRLLPYHVLQQPREDLDGVKSYLKHESKRKGKSRASGCEIKEEIEGSF
jgi:hypothetical protein